jgi:hypothetical protein
MPYTWAYDPRQRRGHVVMTGVVTGEEFAEAMDALYLGPHWLYNSDALWDLRGARAAVSLEGLAAIVRRTFTHSRVAGRGRTAFVVLDPDVRLLGRLIFHRARRTGRARRLFATPAEAEAWLDDPSPDELHAARGHLAGGGEPEEVGPRRESPPVEGDLVRPGG